MVNCHESCISALVLLGGADGQGHQYPAAHPPGKYDKNEIFTLDVFAKVT